MPGARLQVGLLGPAAAALMAIRAMATAMKMSATAGKNGPAPREERAVMFPSERQSAAADSGRQTQN